MASKPTEIQPFPTGAYGKRFEDMSKVQLLSYLKILWNEKENYRARIARHNRELLNDEI